MILFFVNFINADSEPMVVYQSSKIPLDSVLSENDLSIL